MLQKFAATWKHRSEPPLSCQCSRVRDSRDFFTRHLSLSPQENHVHMMARSQQHLAKQPQVLKLPECVFRFECVETLSLLKGAPVTQQTAQPDAAWMAYLHQQFSAAAGEDSMNPNSTQHPVNTFEQKTHPGRACCTGSTAEVLLADLCICQATNCPFQPLALEFHALLHAGGDLQQLGCMEPGDIPLSAVDFHVSNIIEEVLNNREVLTAALSVGRDPLQAMRDAIWIFSSSTNSRAWLQVTNPMDLTVMKVHSRDCCCMMFIRKAAPLLSGAGLG